MATTLDRGLELDQPVQLQAAGTRRGRLGRALMYLLLVAIAVFFILPLVVVVSASLKFSAEIFTDPGILPADPGFENYTALFARAEFLDWFRNSAIVSSVGTLLTLTFTSLTESSGVAASRFKIVANRLASWSCT